MKRKPKPLDPDELLTSTACGKLLQTAPSSVVKWVNRGLLHSYNTPGGHRRVRAADLVAFARANDMFVPAELRGLR